MQNGPRAGPLPGYFELNFPGKGGMIKPSTITERRVEQDGKKYTDKEFVGILKEYNAPAEDTTAAGKILLAFEGDDQLEIEIKDIALIRKAIDF